MQIIPQIRVSGSPDILLNGTSGAAFLIAGNKINYRPLDETIDAQLQDPELP